MFDIEFYEDRKGKSEVYEYIQQLNKTKSEIEKAKRLLEDYKKRCDENE